VATRAIRIAYMVASVPVLTKRTWSPHGAALQIISAKRMVGSLSH
jgi:hypothetical protein